MDTEFASSKRKRVMDKFPCYLYRNY